MSAPCKRIAMWSGPRNISTAMMRAFENRADCAVVDEPLYAAYLHGTGLAHPARDQVLNSQSADWRVVVAALTGAAPAPVYYQKHMAQHLLPAMDLSFTEALLNCFLIREPRRIIASYARVRASFALQELGFSQQKRLFDRECQRLGEAPRCWMRSWFCTTRARCWRACVSAWACPSIGPCCAGRRGRATATACGRRTGTPRYGSPRASAPRGASARRRSAKRPSPRSRSGCVSAPRNTTGP